MGRGLVEPVDQMHEASPATHPALLNRLADDFAGHGFDLQRLMGAILHSEAYLRSSRWQGSAPRPADVHYAVALSKPLSPSQYVISIAVATGYYDQLRAEFAREKKGGSPGADRRLFARERDVQQFQSQFDGFEANAAQGLLLSHDSLFAKQFQPSQGNLVERLAKQTDNARAVREAWLAVLSRPPSDVELAEAVALLSGERPARAERCRELVWTLVGGAEFRFAH